MNIISRKSPSIPDGRLLSLDFFRGFTMFLLIGEFTNLFYYLTHATNEGSFWHAVFMQLHHYPWHGLHFWDLVQPFFMFIVGVAIPFSVKNRIKRGDTEKDLLGHAVKRSFLMLFLGWALFCIALGKITFHFQNVLAQLSVTYLLAFLIRNKSFRFQLIFSISLLLITELIYRFFPVVGFNHPFTPNENFGTWLDLQYGGASLHSHWVSFNAIPTAVHTIWGVMAGKLLLSNRSQREKFLFLAIAGIIGIVAGYAMDPITPIIKRIATSSFVIASGGYALLVLALSYWLIDIKKSRNWVIFFAVVGMNPLFIYLFASVDGGNFLKHIYKPFTHLLFSPFGAMGENILTSMVIWASFWYITWWMYKRKIFIKI